MYIRRFSAKNYKSVFETGPIEFAPGINVITGQNNAGKSSMLTLLSGKFSNAAHRSKKTIPIAGISLPAQKSEVEMEFTIPLREFQEYIFGGHFTEFILENYSMLNIPPLRSSQVTQKDFFSKRFGDEVNIKCQVQNGKLVRAQFPQLGNIQDASKVKFDIIDRKLTNPNTYSGGSASDFISYRVGSMLLNRIYRFSAERFNIGDSLFGKDTVLAHNATNLPEVLSNLQANPTLFPIYNQLVTTIFPSINYVSVVAHELKDKHVQIRIYNDDPKMERSDLTVALEECGTGVAQVLSILYVVVTADVPKVIIIDEPNSFLHPGAARKLIEILKEYTDHQFIIATHSPATIAAANPNSIHMTIVKSAMTSLVPIDLKAAENQNYYLAEIGVKLSDVFGADNILWVEGRTEEICFPLIVQHIDEVSLRGTAILGVKHTSDFDASKIAKSAVEIYTKLSSGAGLLPAAIGFIFDRENRTDQFREDLHRQSNGTAVFLKRRMFENYLLNPDAIISVIAASSGFNFTADAVNKWFETNQWNEEFISKKFAEKKSNGIWLIEVDGARLLGRLFSALTESKLEFSKVEHSVMLCNWILTNASHEMDEISDLLRHCLKQKV